MAVCRCIAGSVVVESTGQPARGASVQLSTLGRRGQTQLARTQTDDGGRFSFEVEPYERRGDIGTYILEVRQGAQLLPSHGDTRVRAGRDAKGLVICVEIPEKCGLPADAPEPGTPPALSPSNPARVNKYCVLIRHSDGTIVTSGLTVTAHTVVLGVVTDVADGQLDAPMWWFSDVSAGTSEVDGKDVLVKVFDSATSTLIATSYTSDFKRAGVVLNPVTVCDEAFRGPSEFATITDAMEAFGPIYAMDLPALAWLQGKTGWSLNAMTLRVIAGDIGDSDPAYSREGVYGALRKGIAATLRGFLAATDRSILTAIGQARFDNTIRWGFNASLFLDWVHAKRAEVLATSTANDGLGTILATSGILTTEQIEAFCEIYVEPHASDTAFWTAVAAHTEFVSDAAAVTEAKRLVRLGTIGLGHAAVVSAMLGELGSGPARYTAAWDEATWADVADATSPLPAGLAGATTPERKASLAALLQANAQRAFPRTALNSTLGSATGYTGLSTFLGDNPNLDLATAKLYPGSPGIDFTNIGSDLPALKQAQRLLRITADIEKTSAIAKLTEKGYTSARDVARRGRSRFVDHYGEADEGEREVARMIFARAHSQAAMASSIYLQAHPNLGGLQTSFIANDDATSEIDDTVIPGWSELFSSNGVACAECLSIHSPAAYLVDLFEWLKTKPSPEDDPTFATAYDALVARRPDLPQIALSCENTDRALPYIDLTVEALEAVVPDAGVPTAHDTVATTLEMLASPQYLLDAAYGEGALGAPHTEEPVNLTAQKAFLTPFSRALVEARAFLAFLGTSRADLMRTYNGTVESPTNREISAEALGLSMPAVTVLETANTTSAEASFWPFDLTVPTTVGTLRAATQLSVQEVLDLLHTRVVNTDPAGRAVSLVLQTDADPYDVDSYVLGVVVPAMAVSQPTYTDFSNIRQFIRLWRSTGLTMLQVDKVLAAFGLSAPGSWSSTSPLTNVGNLLRLVARVGADPIELAAWFAVKMDTWSDRPTKETPEPSLYAATFLAPSLVPTSEAGAHPFHLNDAATEIEDTVMIASVHDHLRAVLGIDEASLGQLLAQLSLNGPSVALTLARITDLFKWCSLGRAARVPVDDAWRLANLAGMAPMDSPSDAIRFLELADRVAGSGFKVDHLSYFLRNGAVDRVGPTLQTSVGRLGRIRDAVKALYASDGSLSGFADETARKVAAEFGFSDATMSLLRTAAWPNVPALSGSHAFVLPAAASVNTFGMPVSADLTAGAQVVALLLTADVDLTVGGPISAGTVVYVPVDSSVSVQIVAGEVAASAEIALVGSGTPVVMAFSIPSGSPVRLAAGSTQLLLSGAVLVLASGDTVTTAENVSIEPVGDVTVTLGDNRTSVELDGVRADDVVVRFLRQPFWEPEVSAGSDPWTDIGTDPAYEDDLDVAIALAKASMLIEGLNADSDECAAWFARTEALGWDLFHPAELGNMDISAGDTPARLLNTIDLFGARARLPGSTPTFAEVISASLVHIPAVVSARTGWDSTDVAQAFGFLSDLDAVKIRITLDRIDLARRVGARPNLVGSWGGAGTLDFAGESAEIVAAAASKYVDPAAWAATARPVRDQVRKAQRDALVSFLVAKGFSAGLRNADDLYQKYLIDVSMNPEMLTSRIKQACCSIQLFVHRALFGLEVSEDADLGTYFNDEDRAEWEWMRTYRIWEAARKVFLYPENWIEPELRDDKTPFFVQLEQELAQGDVSDERVEGAVLDYLDRLHEVASLEVLACYQETQSGDTPADRFHVFARSHSDPPTYWYRRRDDGATWTAWQQIQAGIQGDHLIPVVYNRRLLLFWAEFTEQRLAQKHPSPARWWDISLAMSELRGEKWSPKVVGATVLSLEGASSDGYDLCEFAVDQYGFVSSVSTANELRIDCIVSATVGAAGHASFYTVGTFVLDACTMKLEVVEVEAASETERLAVEPSGWDAPGYETGYQSPSGGIDDDVAVYVADTNDDGTVMRNVHTVSVLGSLFGTVVVPGQWRNFVSQSPFFMSQGSRVYFVEPTLGASISTGVDTNDPSVAGLASNRQGTAPEAAPADATLTDDEQLTLSVMVGDYQYPSQAEQVAALTASADQLGRADQLTPITSSDAKFRFSRFYHPYVCTFVREVRRQGVFGLLNPNPLGEAGLLFRQQLDEDGEGHPNDFDTRYEPTLSVLTPYPREQIDFDQASAYGQYNWEVFFHVPLYLANQLASAGRYQEALDYFHCIFDPRTRAAAPDGSAPNGTPWRVKPFLEPASAPVVNWAAFSGANGDATAAAAFESQVAAWRADPFNPHLLARLRAGTYPRAVVMKYVDTLIAWGDQLFTTDTIETLNEATQLYVFAKQVLGNRPEAISTSAAPPAPKTYLEIADTIDAFGNAFENTAPTSQSTSADGSGAGVLVGAPLPPYFCIPINAQLWSYWDIVDDRLFKLRNGMNIEGVARTLPLFEPPIDPALLVRAAAAGVNIGTAYSDALGDVGNYRFSVMLGRAQALAGSVRTLGGALLSALEKRDSEALALLRQTQEAELLNAVRSVREQQIEDSRAALGALEEQKAATTARRAYYTKLKERGSIAEERAAARLTEFSITKQVLGTQVTKNGAVLAAFPSISAGIAAAIKVGGETFANVVEALGKAIVLAGSVDQTMAGYLSTAAGYRRRKEDWAQQITQATHDLDGIEKQIEGASIRLEIAKAELRNQDLQIEHSAQVREFMERKFTNADLYDWMARELSALHFQAWQLAFATAKKAERAFNHELGRTDAFVQSVSWDATRKGLLAGEKLSADLERMDLAYLDRDAREFELVKHVPLTLLDPIALESLRTEGQCWFEIDESMFDADCPNHYFRRLQSVAVSLATVAGPLGTINAELTLVAHRRRDTDTGELSDWNQSAERVVTSVGMNDTGVFSADPRDPRYLPFERRGAISRWGLRFTATQWKQFDWSTLTDVTLHLRYTARGGSVTRDVAEDPPGLAGRGFSFGSSAFVGDDEGLSILVAATRDAPDSWFVAKSGTSGTVTFTVALPDIEGMVVDHVYAIPIGTATIDNCTIGGEEATPPGSIGGLPAWRVDEVVTSPIAVECTVDVALPSPHTEPADLSGLDELLLVVVMR